MAQCQHEWIVRKEVGDLAQSRCLRCGETRDGRRHRWWGIGGNTIGFVLTVAAVAYASERSDLAPIVIHRGRYVSWADLPLPRGSGPGFRRRPLPNGIK